MGASVTDHKSPLPDLLKTKRVRSGEIDLRNTKKKRLTGACVGCSLFGKFCEEDTACGTCLKKLTNARTFPLPCFENYLDASIIPFEKTTQEWSSNQSVPIRKPGGKVHTASSALVRPIAVVVHTNIHHSMPSNPQKT